MERKKEIMNILSVKIREVFDRMQVDFQKLQEIRLRAGEPLLIVYDNEEFFAAKNGTMSKRKEEAYQVSAVELRNTLELLSNYSLYAYEEEIKQGFITIQGGHRIGLAGKVVMEKGAIKSVKYISFLNIRLAHEVKGCAQKVMPYLLDGQSIYHTLIISPPRCGKTTLLRDMIRQLSNGEGESAGATIGVVDERSEIAACYLGVPQNDVGIRTDILDCCPKANGMLMLLRSMSPQIIAVDEVGSREDIEAIEYVINCGCKLIATVHGSSIEDITSKPVLRSLVERKFFERYIILNNKASVGHIDKIFDSQGNQLYMEDDI